MIEKGTLNKFLFLFGRQKCKLSKGIHWRIENKSSKYEK